MKVVILAGGLGTRISEESHLKPMIVKMRSRRRNGEDCGVGEGLS